MPLEMILKEASQKNNELNGVKSAKRKHCSKWKSSGMGVPSERLSNQLINNDIFG